MKQPSGEQGGGGAPPDTELDFDVYYYDGPIDNTGYISLVKAVAGEDGAGPTATNAVLMLSTFGGSADDAYRIARFLKRSYEQFFLLAPLYCYSAGTLLAIGADHLLVTHHTEFGPLDVQLLKQDEIAQPRRSGLLSQTAFRALGDVTFEHFERFMLDIVTKSRGVVTFRVAAELSASMTASVMSGVYARLDPESLASDRRDVEVAWAYAWRLAEQSQNVHPHTIGQLILNYPSHNFVIDHVEVKELFLRVSEAPESLMTLINDFISDLDIDGARPVVFKVYSGGQAISAPTGDGNESSTEARDPEETQSSSEPTGEPNARKDGRAKRNRSPKGGADRSKAGDNAGTE